MELGEIEEKKDPNSQTSHRRSFSLVAGTNGFETTTSRSNMLRYAVNNPRFFVGLRFFGKF
jgi:hypothetical protein